MNNLLWEELGGFLVSGEIIKPFAIMVCKAINKINKMIEAALNFPP